MNNLRRGCLHLNTKSLGVVRQVQNNASLLENCVEIRNRNPRNLEMLTIALKPVGYHLDQPGHEYWHKLFITATGSHLTAEIHHFKNGPVVTVSTKEWALKKQLYKTLDKAAFTNVGRILAQRCIESGISSICCDIDVSNSEKMSSFLEELKKGGVTLEEPPVYEHKHPWELTRMVKPWTIVE